MGEWKSVNLSNIVPDEISQLTGAVGTVTDVVSQAISGMSSALSVLSGLIIDVNDPLKAVIDTAVSRIEVLTESIFNVLQSGVYFYHDAGPLLTGANPDGFSGFISRLDASLRDPSDINRPVFHNSSQIEAVVLCAGADDIPGILSIARLMGELFGIQKFNYASDRLMSSSKSLPEEILQSMPSPPDWYSLKLKNIIPPLADLDEIIKQTLGMIRTPPAFGDSLAETAKLLEEKAGILQETSQQIQNMAQQLTLLTSTPGLTGLRIKSNNGMEDFITKIKNANNKPEWNYNSWVIGVVLLGGSSDFAAIPPLFGL